MALLDGSTGYAAWFALGALCQRGFVAGDRDQGFRLTGAGRFVHRGGLEGEE